MSLGLVGRKVGMTRIFAEDGRTIPVTVLDVSDNRVSQIKTIETDGYAAVQVAYGKRRASRITKPVAGHLAKAGVEAGDIITRVDGKVVDKSGDLPRIIGAIKPGNGGVPIVALHQVICKASPKKSGVFSVPAIQGVVSAHASQQVVQYGHSPKQLSALR